MMNKLEFLRKLRKGLSGMPRAEKEERLNFYEEMIEDYIEEGLSEEQAVQKIGEVEDIVFQIRPEEKINKRTTKSERSAWKNLLIIVGSPIWFALLVSAFAVVISIFASLWAVVITLWATFISLIVGGVGSIILFVIVSESTISLIAIVGAGIFDVGLAIFLFYGCRALTKSSVLLAKKSVIIIRDSFRNRRDV